MKHLFGRICSLAICVALAGAANTAVARPAIDSVTVIVVAPASGGLSTKIDEPERVKTLMKEINTERQKLWKPFKGKLSSCAVRFAFYEQDRRLARLVLDGNDLIEFAAASETTGFAREVARSELDAVRRLASKVKSQSSCSK
jgi:hypothetical protein